jgi:hypothetical protein
MSEDMDETVGCVNCAENYEKEITRLRAELARYKEDSEFLARLTAAGVDNWEGYGEACQGD